ncbi:MAG: nitroreductase family protein [Synergistales bacterium]|jgi:nitroreductase
MEASVGGNPALEVLRRRRSIRKYRDQPLEGEEIEVLKEIVLRAPSAHNFKSWEFIFVDDRDLLKRLSEVRGGSSAFLAGASLGIVALGNEKTQDVWVEDASVASMLAQLAAASMGIGSCWVQIRNRDHAPGVTAEDYVREVLDIPLPFRVLSILGMGYPAEEKPPAPIETLCREKIHFNGF